MPVVHDKCASSLILAVAYGANRTQGLLSSTRSALCTLRRRFSSLEASLLESGVYPFGTDPTLGHTHIRNCGKEVQTKLLGSNADATSVVQFDGRSMALESGRYMETVGMSKTFLSPSKSVLTILLPRMDE